LVKENPFIKKWNVNNYDLRSYEAHLKYVSAQFLHKNTKVNTMHQQYGLPMLYLD
jgi:hypothetical protein